MEDAELRLTPDEGMYFIHCTAEEADKLIHLTEDGAATSFEASVACIGNRICQVGLRDSQALLKACVDAVRPFSFTEGTLPKIHISGCPSSCGTHQIGTLSFRGAVKQTPDGPKAAFALFEGGSQELGKAHFANEICIMPEENIPKIFTELGQRISKDGLTYNKWIVNNKNTLVELAKKYT